MSRGRGEQRGVGVLLGAGNGVSHPLHQLLQGVVHKLVHVHGDHWVLLAAQHGAREGEMIPIGITEPR